MRKKVSCFGAYACDVIVLTDNGNYRVYGAGVWL